MRYVFGLPSARSTCSKRSVSQVSVAIRDTNLRLLGVGESYLLGFSLVISPRARHSAYQTSSPEENVWALLCSGNIDKLLRRVAWKEVIWFQQHDDRRLARGGDDLGWRSMQL